MAAIVHELPFHAFATTLTLGDGSTIVLANHQIILWVSLSPAGLDEHPVIARPFPAVLDTGFNHGFLIQERQFQAWTAYNLHSNDFPVRGHLRAYGGQADLHEADLWLHANVRGRRDELSRAAPLRLQLERGVAISPVADQPRLPLLGMMAIEKSGLKLLIDGARRRVTLRT